MNVCGHADIYGMIRTTIARDVTITHAYERSDGTETVAPSATRHNQPRNRPCEKPGIDAEYDLNQVRLSLKTTQVDVDAYQTVDHSVRPGDRIHIQSEQTCGNNHLRKPVRELCNREQRSRAMKKSPAAAVAFTAIASVWTRRWRIIHWTESA